MFIVLNAVSVPTTDIGLLFVVDWLTYAIPPHKVNYFSDIFNKLMNAFFHRDRMRTTNNLLGDCYATVFVEHFSKKELREMDNIVVNSTDDDTETSIAKPEMV